MDFFNTLVNSGYGLHVTYLLSEPSSDKATWKKIQRALCRRFAVLGADRKVAPDESRVLRLVPYPNRKRWPEGLPTGILYTSESRYELGALGDAVGLNGGTNFSRLEVLSFTPQPFDSCVAEADQAHGRRDYAALWGESARRPHHLHRGSGTTPTPGTGT